MNNTISSKLGALAIALIVNGMIMGAVGYPFEIPRILRDTTYLVGI